MRIEAPLETELTRELFEFWFSIFGEPLDLPPEVFLGAELEQNSNAVYLTRRDDGGLAGTCGLNTSKAVPVLGGLGEVATDPRLRGSGIATALCRQAVDDFRNLGGQALFLGTGNPDAARIYYRLGWRKLAGANVMANISNGDSPEAFLVDYTRGLGSAQIRPASPDVRIPLIPLMVLPHDWLVLDSNAAMFSTRYATQHSCMGLYRRYNHLLRDGKGAWFCAVTQDARVVGSSTARLDGSGACRVDAFTLGSHMETWTELVASAMGWSEAAGAVAVQVVVAVEDEEKRALFEGLGFVYDGAGEPFDLDGRRVRTELLLRR